LKLKQLAIFLGTLLAIPLLMLRNVNGMKSMKEKIKLVVIGNGPVGHNFLEYLVESGESDNYQVTVFGEEPLPAYDRVHLTSWFKNQSVDDINMVSEGFYPSNNFTLHSGDKVTQIDRFKRVITSDAGLEVSYDKIILATGSVPFVPPVPGHDRDNVFVYRTIEDLEKITAAAKTGKVGAVIGGGLLGLEAAKALMDLDLKTHVIEFAPRLMAVQIDDGGGKMLSRKIQDLGVSVHTQKNTQNIGDGETAFHKMSFADGQELETDIIVFSAGIRPRDELARQAGLGMGARGGVVINNNCLTSDNDIYAIGEVALWDNKIYGLIAPGNTMAKAAVDHLTGTGSSEFAGADMSTKLKLMGVDVASIGDAHATTPNSRSYTYVNDREEVYKKIVVSEDDKHLLGAVLIGDAAEYGSLLQFMLNKMELPSEPEGLILPSLDGSSSGIGVDALPDSAVLCSCMNVSKADVINAVEAGASDMAAIKSCTKAATGCGGCTALVTQVLNCELEKQGVEVNTNLCEHFSYTRQDLYNIIRVEKIKSFEELLENHGSGLGCDICKPTTANILASCWNDHVLDNKLQGLQDTNDYFMGNMQKDGTYSVVPRVPGGEITPEKLIVLGEVAKKYDLYTKITGGQRVDLFGARSEQLPDIWRELVDAGFETGHAYGKSLRTVKSCVGSTWCRYGVQDSMALSILLENRYKGLRSPHKLKMAVSGCTRECAEAQSKDVGIIATENGWNMYVCGNGGMKPRHADLFASDLNDVDLIKYIDRFYMFYVRTADRLQRTSVWMDNMEGGLEYLKSVIIEDKLGLAAELEQEMSAVVDTYQCEWKTTIEDPEKMKRFGHFVNSKLHDENVIFTTEREQIRPALTSERTSETA